MGEINFHASIESCDGFREWLSKHLSIAKKMILSFHKKGEGDRFFLNGHSTEMFKVTIEDFCDAVRRARGIDEELESARQLLVQLRSVNKK